MCGFWEAASYQVEEYPDGVLTIDVFTLSTQEQLINVGCRFTF